MAMNLPMWLLSHQPCVFADFKQTRMFLSSCCPKLTCVWQQMVRGKVYLAEIVNRRNYPVAKYQQSSSREEKSLLMDINELEEQYDSIRQKQKEQTHVIFKTGKSKHESGEFFKLQVKTVSVNCTVKKPKAFEEHLPVNNVTLDFPNKDYVQDGETPWRTHLDIYRVLQAQNTGQKSHLQANKEPDDQNQQPPSMSNKGLLNKGRTKLCYYKGASGEVTTHITCKPNELKATHSFTNRNHCIPKINKRFSFPNERSSVWSSKNGLLTKIVPVAIKGDHYPFPQMKTPRKSDTAKNLGLYAK
ncbi:TBC1 domain family member 30-like [Hemiscyllium ocellatum]|uniref:TBC1 domain family member 30-like n=1 Tax=Hemiscyllium ocellatum TaxID=170820 RepID=UPI00296769E8|nr:TBC1 domain family member 30-like [Hemiscyllium ocellatum]